VNSKPIDLNDSTILVTGGTGSFGQRLCRTILERYNPKKLIIFSRDELKQFEMAHHPDFRDHHETVRYFIGDVRDADRLQMAFRDVDFVIHAAALKQVPTAEYNPFECIRTNVHGAENVVTAAIRCGVQRVVALSTDKAANPINLYGASKLASDKIFTAAMNLVGIGDPLFCAVRYGNVLGSRGSVVPFFRKIIAEGATELPITDPRMTRFWITLQQGVDFVLSCLGLMQGGEIFVPKIPSMEVTKLAETIAPGVAHNTVGIRPGEKLHEDMITEADARTVLELPDRYIIRHGIYVKTGYHPDEKPVLDDFRYSSNANDDWLDTERIAVLLSELEASQP
jgi:UDP-N-acetylglucosamine 4,6-dehydratase/5-epimerase